MKKKQGQTNKLQRENAVLKDLLYHLSFDADRVSHKYGHDDNDVPSDWKEWVNLRKSIREAQLALK